jgi:hypothetical protein
LQSGGRSVSWSASRATEAGVQAAVAHPEWPAPVMEAIDDRQERAYWAAADLLDLPGPDAAYKALSESKKSASMEEFRATLGWENALTGEEWERTKARTEAYMARPLAPPSTRFEDASSRDRWLSVREKITMDSERVGAPRMEIVPHLATLPSGDLNAVVTRCHEGAHEIIFFERGLERYLRDFALLVCWMVPPMPEDFLWNDRGLALIRGPYTMPPQSSQYFLSTLGAYLGGGTPFQNQMNTALPGHNAHLFIFLTLGLFEFVLMHEQAHVTLGHVAERRRGHEVELEADRHAARVLAKLAQDSDRSRAFSLWTSDLALRALSIFDEAMGTLAFGIGPKWWLSQTHPDPHSRRAAFREAVAPHEVHDISDAALDNLLKMGDALLGRIEEMTWPSMAWARRRGMTLSPLWRARLERSMKPKETPEAAQEGEGAGDG